MLSLLYCKGMHLSPSEFSFSLHAQKISHGMENSQTSVLCAGQQVSSVFSRKNSKAFSGCTQKEQTSCSAIRCSPLWKTQAPRNSYGPKSFQTGPGHSQIFKALLKVGFHSPVSFSIQFSFSTAPHPRYFSLNWNASHHCFLSMPLARLVIYCTSAFCKPQPATRRTEPCVFCLAPEEKKAAH